MPKIAEKQTVLNGRGSVVRFASGTSVGNYVYREWDNSIRNYRTKHILEAKSLEEAIAMARICGNSVATIMQTYERIDIRRRTKELTDIEFGSKKGNPETISLFDE